MSFKEYASKEYVNDIGLEAKEYAKDYTDINSVTTTTVTKGSLTFGGDATGYDVIDPIGDGSYLFVKVLDRALEKYEIESAVLTVKNVGAGTSQSVTRTNSELTFGNINDSGFMIAYSDVGTPWAASINEEITENGLTLSKGTWVICHTSNETVTYCSEIYGVLAESRIIDPKYLPFDATTVERMVVTLSDDLKTASHSASEIIAYCKNGGTVVLDANNGYAYVYNYSEQDNSVYFADIAIDDIDNNVVIGGYKAVVHEDKSVEIGVYMPYVGVASVNDKNGIVKLTAEDVGAAPKLMQIELTDISEPDETGMRTATANYSSTEINEHIQNGGYAVVNYSFGDDAICTAIPTMSGEGMVAFTFTSVQQSRTDNTVQECIMILPDKSVMIMPTYATGNIISVNGETGEIVLTAKDVGALPEDTEIPSVKGLATTYEVELGDYDTLNLAKNYTDEARIGGEYFATYNPEIHGTTPPFGMDDLVGLKVRTKRPPRYFLTTPEERPTTTFDDNVVAIIANIDADEVLFTKLKYDDFSGVLNKDVLSLEIDENKALNLIAYYGGTIRVNYPNYTHLIYCYEETSDTLGRGLTVPKGWYVINTSTFAFAPFDIENNPFSISEAELQQSDDKVMQEYGIEKDQYFFECFKIKERFEYTIAPENICTFFTESGSVKTEVRVVAQAHISNIPEYSGLDAIVTTFAAAPTLAFTLDENGEFNGGSAGTVEVGYPVLKKIDPKYLPDGGVGYTEGGKVIIPETVVPDDYIERVGRLNLVVGKEYVVTFDCVHDGEAYHREAVLTAQADNGYVFVTGEGFPAEIGNDLNENKWYIEQYTGEQATITVKEKEVIHPIDPKYLPEGGFGYTELGKVLRTATLSIEDGVGVAEFESPIHLEEGKTYTVTTDNGSYEVVCERYYEEDGTPFPWLWVGSNTEIGQETYSFYYGETDGGESNVAIDFNGGATFSISTTETIHTIDPKYLPEGGFGYSELNKVQEVFNGDVTNKEVYGTGSEQFVKISDEVIDLHAIKGLVGFSPDLGEETVTSDMYEVLQLTLNITSIHINGVTFMIAVSEDGYLGNILLTKGTYVLLNEEENSYVSKVILPEVIHKIDPKYLPEIDGTILTVTDVGNGVASNSATEIVDCIRNGGLAVFRMGGAESGDYAYYVGAHEGNLVTFELMANMASDGMGQHMIVTINVDADKNITYIEEGTMSGVASVNGKTGAVVLTAEDIGALPAEDSVIIDVTELPTENINDNVFYRLLTATILFNKTPQPMFTCYIVEDLPVTGLPTVNANQSQMYSYYSMADANVYGYIDSNLSAAMSVPVGWYTADILMSTLGYQYKGIITDVKDASSDGAYCLLLEPVLYTYDGTWKTFNTVGRKGTGSNAEIFNSPDNQAIGYHSHAEGYETCAEGSSSHAEGQNTTAIGNCSHAEGKGTTTIEDASHAEGSGTCAHGTCSHAEGLETYAYGGSSHAEGSETYTRGICSHAEGSKTIANGTSSHAEGTETCAEGLSSHAEGYNSVASGEMSHAEGRYTRSTGVGSHSEGYYTNAFGINSHAEGAFDSLTLLMISGKPNATIYSVDNVSKMAQLHVGMLLRYNLKSACIESIDIENNTITLSNTLSVENGITRQNVDVYHGTISYGEASHAEGLSVIAQGHAQHAQGKCNAVDIDDKYAHIVGNGLSVLERSNAHTLDWNGVGWFQGGLQVGGNAQDDGAKNVLLEGDAIPIPKTAEVGQTIRVSAVDENGVPTAWEAAPSGKWRYIGRVTPEEDVISATLSVDSEGRPFSLSRVLIQGVIAPNTSDAIGWVRPTINGHLWTIQSSLTGCPPGEGVNGCGFRYELEVIADRVFGRLPLGTQNATNVYDLLCVVNNSGVDSLRSQIKITQINSIGLAGWQAGVIGAGSYFDIWGIDI